MTVAEFLARHPRTAKTEAPSAVINLPLARTPRQGPTLPAVPLNLLGNDALRAIGRDVVAEMMRRARASHNAWDGDRLTLDEVISWLGGETYDARLEKTSRTVGLDVLPITREATEGGP